MSSFSYGTMKNIYLLYIYINFGEGVQVFQFCAYWLTASRYFVNVYVSKSVRAFLL